MSEHTVEWISVDERLPRPFEHVWIFWRDREILIGYRTYVDDEEKSQPADEGWYSTEDDKCRWAHWWAPIIKPMNKPDISFNPIKPPRIETKHDADIKVFGRMCVLTSPFPNLFDVHPICECGSSTWDEANIEMGSVMGEKLLPMRINRCTKCESPQLMKRSDPPEQIITNDNWIFNMKITSELKSIEDQSLGQMSNE